MYFHGNKRDRLPALRRTYGIFANNVQIMDPYSPKKLQPYIPEVHLNRIFARPCSAKRRPPESFPGLSSQGRIGAWTVNPIRAISSRC